MIRLEIPLVPTPWAAPKVFGRITMDIRQNHKKDVVLLLKAQYKGKQIEGPIHLGMAFEMPIPNGTSKKKRALMIEGKIHHTKKPDASNIFKLVEDCLEKAGIIANDSQVVETHSSKYYSENPKTIITITELV